MQDTLEITGAGYDLPDCILWKKAILFLFSKRIQRRSTT